MAQVTSRNLQARLLILVFLAFIPAMGFFWYANRELRNLQMEAKEQELVKRAEVTAAEYRTLMSQSQAFISTLGRVSRDPERPVSGLHGIPRTNPSAYRSVHPQSPLSEWMGTRPAVPSLHRISCTWETRAYFVRATTRKIFSGR